MKDYLEKLTPEQIKQLATRLDFEYDDVQYIKSTPQYGEILILTKSSNQYYTIDDNGHSIEKYDFEQMNISTYEVDACFGMQREIIYDQNGGLVRKKGFNDRFADARLGLKELKILTEILREVLSEFDPAYKVDAIKEDIANTKEYIDSMQDHIKEARKIIRQDERRVQKLTNEIQEMTIKIQTADDKKDIEDAQDVVRQDETRIQHLLDRIKIQTSCIKNYDERMDEAKQVLAELEAKLAAAMPAAPQPN